MQRHRAASWEEQARPSADNTTREKNDNQANTTCKRQFTTAALLKKFSNYLIFLHVYVHFTVTILKLNCFQCFSLHFRHLTYFNLLLQNAFAKEKKHQKAPRNLFYLHLKSTYCFSCENLNFNWKTIQIEC